ncbi:MAG: hypothetical protein KC458_01980, partial [Dehalococcoidia bacterium]|nr:hypothetical protein [Dehalococcoidia bacterium]
MSSGLTDRAPADAEDDSAGTRTATKGRPATMTGHRASRYAPSVAIEHPEPTRNWFTRIRTFESIGYLAYRNFFLAMLGQMASQNMQMVVRAWLAYELTGSYAAL